MANCACYLENVRYEKMKLKFCKVALDSNDNSLDVSDATDSSDDEEEVMALTSEGPGNTVFLKVLARFRDDLPKGGIHDPFLDDLVPVMKRYHVKTTVPEMRTKKGNMREDFRKLKRDAKESHELFDIYSVIFAGADKRVLKNTAYEWKAEDEVKVKEAGRGDADSDNEADGFMADLLKFSDAPSWTNNSELALVQLFLEYKDMYDDPKRKVNFLRHISGELFHMKYVYKPESCSSKYVALCREYKDLCEDAELTGAPGPLELVKNDSTRIVIEVMHQIKNCDVNVKPAISMSAGVKQTHQVQSITLLIFHGIHFCFWCD